MKSVFVSCSIGLLLAAGCSRPDANSSAPTDPSSGSSAQAPANAEIGKPAPDFTLPDLEGRMTHLGDYRGKVVVLEWFNPGCPFVNLSHTKGSLNGTAARHQAEGIVWIGVDSAGAGMQGSDPKEIREAVTRFNLTHPVLRDTTGAVGHAYGATNTPHLFVIDKQGTLVYAGAIDNSPDAEGQSPQGGPLVNYVDAALADLAAGRPVQTAQTKAYGCGVKYGS